MMPRWHAFLLFAAISSQAGSLDYEVRVEEDRFEGFTRIIMSKNLIPNEPGDWVRASDPTFTSLGAIVVTTDSSTGFFLFSEVVDSDWLFINRMVLLINDSLAIEFTDPLETVRDVQQGMCCERVVFETSPDLLWTIAFADSVEIKLSGEDQFRIRALSPVNVQRFNEFCSEYVPLMDDTMSVILEDQHYDLN